MKRDMDLIRELLLRLEALPMGPAGIVCIDPGAKELAVPGFERNQIEYHLALIRGAGFVDEVGAHPMVGFSFRSLTCAGHDFLDAVRDPKIWEKTRKGVEAAGGFTFDLLKDLAKGFAKKQIEELTGVKL